MTNIISNYNKHLLTSKHFIKVSNNVTKHINNKYICKECNKCKKQFTNSNTRIKHEKKCQEKIIESKEDCNVIINNTNSNNITNNINNYGSEKYDYITNEKLQEISLNSKCRELIDLIYFNKEHPENQNIQLHSNKLQLYKVFLDDCWNTLKKFETVHDEIISKATNIMMKVYEETKVEFDLLEHNKKFGPLLKSKSLTKKNLENHIYCNIASKNL